MPRERIAPQSEVIRVIVLEDSPCCEVPHRHQPPDAGVPEVLVCQQRRDLVLGLDRQRGGVVVDLVPAADVAQRVCAPRGSAKSESQPVVRMIESTSRCGGRAA